MPVNEHFSVAFMLERNFTGELIGSFLLKEHWALTAIQKGLHHLQNMELPSSPSSLIFRVLGAF